jgi:hypothetical protein
MLNDIRDDPAGFLDGIFRPYLGPPDFAPD